MRVTCAGRLCVVDGRLILIDNISGHYKPRRADAENNDRFRAFALGTDEGRANVHEPRRIHDRMTPAAAW